MHYFGLGMNMHITEMVIDHYEDVIRPSCRKETPGWPEMQGQEEATKRYLLNPGLSFICHQQWKIIGCVIITDMMADVDIYSILSFAAIRIKVWL